MATGLLFKWEDSPALCKSMSRLKSLFVCEARLPQPLQDTILTVGSRPSLRFL
jgi:hypothetical protein